MDFTDISSMLVDLAASLEQNQTKEIESTIKRINEALDKKEEDETKRKMVDLMKNATGDEYKIYITKDDDNEELYDICLVLDENCGISYCTTEDILDSAIDNESEGYILEKISKENVRKFMTALYIYDRVHEENQSLGERKDLVYSDENDEEEDYEKYLEFLEVQEDNSIPSFTFNPRVLYVNEISFVEPEVDLIEPEIRESITTFEEALDIVYENRLVGSKLKLIK